MISSNKWLISLFILLFALNPFVAIISFIGFKAFSNANTKNDNFLLFILMTGLSCLIQGTRVWNPLQPTGSDWYNNDYWGLFNAVEGRTFFEYLTYTAKEPMWKVLNFIGYYVTGGEYFYFINFIAMSTIILTSLAVYRYWKKAGASTLTLIASLALVAWSYELIGNMNNILRHFFALSIMMNVFVEKEITGKINWKVLIFALLVHTLSFLFAIFLFIKPLQKKLSLQELKKLVGIFLIIAIVSPILMKVGAHIPVLSYGVQRLQSAANPWDENFKSFNMMAVYVNVLIVVFISWYIIYKSRISSTGYLVTNAAALIMLMSIPLYTIAPELMTRIYISRLFFFPFILPYFIRDWKIHNLYLLVIVVFWGYRFFSGFHTFIGGTSFPHIGDVMTYSLINFLL